MWKWNQNLNLEMNANRNLIDSWKKHAKIGGVVLIIIGIVGIVFPQILTVTTLFLVAYLMMFAGISIALLTYKSNKEDWVGWLKSFILLLSSLLLLFYPMQGVAALGLVFAMACVVV